MIRHHAEFLRSGRRISMYETITVLTETPLVFALRDLCLAYSIGTEEDGMARLVEPRH